MSIAHTETEHEIYIISFRKATRREAQRYFHEVTDPLIGRACLILRTRQSPGRGHPEANLTKVVRGIVRRGLRPAPSKTLISLRLDEDVIEWFKAQGPGYQTRINAVLRAFRDASS